MDRSTFSSTPFSGVSFDPLSARMRGQQWRPGVPSYTGAPKSDQQEKVLIAVDFGTTYSAVAWAVVQADAGSSETLQDVDIHVIDEWPESDTNQKVPTLLSYEDNGEIAWGFPVREFNQRFEWFKLEQDTRYSRDERMRQYPNTAIIPAGLEQVQIVIRDYLSCLRQHAEEKIREQYRAMDVEEVLDIPWEYVITVPALWPESAQNITLGCAKNAGMTTVKIIAEPEAAGVHGLSILSHEARRVARSKKPGTQPQPMKKGDTFMVCDAGGGTVDLIAYTITKEGPNPTVAETAPGTGGFCGSSFLDRRFDQWLSNRFAKCPGWKKRNQAAVVDQWERRGKRNFKGHDSDTFTVRVSRPDHPDLGIVDEKLTVTSRQIRDIFRPVVDQVAALVRQQLSSIRQNGSEVKTIFMVGGFGNNQYLHRRIVKEVGSKIRVSRVEHCETAVVRGALLRGVTTSVSSPISNLPNITIEAKRARRHYGTVALDQYNPAWHGRSRHRIPGGLNGGERVEVMRWMVNKGKLYKDGEPLEFAFNIDQSMASVQSRGKFAPVPIPIYICETDERPGSPDEFPPGNNCRNIATLTPELDRIPKENIKLEDAEDGSRYYKLSFCIQMIRHLENVRFNLVVRSDGGKGPARTIDTCDVEWLSI